MTDFWKVIAVQTRELGSAKTADEVFAILSAERNPYGPGTMAGSAQGFYAGEAGEMLEALEDGAGRWTLVWLKASYHWCAEAPNGDKITYVEGDIYRGDQQ